MNFTTQQLEGYRHAPSKLTRRLAATAESALDRAERAETELRDAQEQLAAAQLSAEARLLVVLHRNGQADVWARDWTPVHVVCLHDLGPGREDEAEDEMLKRLPMAYRELFTVAGKVILTGTCRGCLDRTGYEYMQIVRSTHGVLKQWEREAAHAG